MSAATILHLTPAAGYEGLAEGEPLRPTSLAVEGFIHCTATAEALLRVANAFYREAPGEFLVLEIDPARLTAPVRFEPPAPPPPAGHPLAGHLFPHIYGPLNVDAVVAVRAARRAADGTFLEV